MPEVNQVRATREAIARSGTSILEQANRMYMSPEALEMGLVGPDTLSRWLPFTAAQINEMGRD